MRTVFQGSVMSLKHRRIVFTVIVFLIGLLVGTIIGPRLQVMYWTAQLERNPNVWGKAIATLHLGDTEIGRDSLYKHLKSPNKMIRILSVRRLGEIEPLWYVFNLQGFVPEGAVDERVEILDHLECGEQEAFVFGALRVELKKEKDPRIKAKINEVLRSWRKINKNLPQD